MDNSDDSDARESKEDNVSDATDNENDGRDVAAEGGAPLPLQNFHLDYKLIALLLSTDLEVLDRIPPGIKENCFFFVDNSNNVERRSAKIKSIYDDDCGAWRSSPSPISRFVRSEDGWRSVVKREGLICSEGKSGGHHVYMPLEPQPDPNDLIEVHRNLNDHQPTRDKDQSAPLIYFRYNITKAKIWK